MHHPVAFFFSFQDWSHHNWHQLQSRLGLPKTDTQVLINTKTNTELKYTFAKILMQTVPSELLPSLTAEVVNIHNTILHHNKD